MVRRRLLRTPSRRLVTVAAFLLATVAATGCGHRNDDKDSAFCAFLTDLNSLAYGAASPEEGLAILKAKLPQLQQEAASAPEDLRPDISTVIDASQTAVATNDLSALTTDDVAQAGERLSASCGVTPPSPIASPSPTAN
jgi:hypothetical protein